MNTWIELSRDAFEHNVRMIIQRLGDCQIGFVVKSNAYGHGLYEMVILAHCYPQINWLCVARWEEAYKIRKLWSKDILIMADDYTSIPVLAEDIVFGVGSWEQIKRLHAYALRDNRLPRIHLKIDTGMSRLGFSLKNTYDLITTLHKKKILKIEGIFSHCSDTAQFDYSFARVQQQCFHDLLRELRFYGYVFENSHLYASGTLHEEQCYRLLRVGGSLYGMFKSEFHHQRLKTQLPQISLKPVLCIKARIIKKIIGKPPRGIIALGYEHGLPIKAEGILLEHCFIEKVYAHYTLIRILDPLLNIVSLSVLDYAPQCGLLVNEALCALSTKIPRIIV